MSESVTDGTIRGTTMQTIGGAVLALTLLLSAFFFFDGDFVTGGILLLYVPVAVLLVLIGRTADLV